ncbi:hypothetical protein N7532_010213 [Penicillium argentinense]|uniref:Uncharacterized protein n=1 Tax=Penicillium argentinense TaxID=1131581 RepID=A0A9W9JYA6_9EURO|nr:uncharacterized protein N7532_010213 [Penicillium argentinense]KAJ5085442.1 hypothetical protein N7532_010213 [Penicillium argentinense]
MLDRYGLAEPRDPSIWRQIDDPTMLGMCTRLLAKTLEPDTYPTKEKSGESLKVTQKLFAQPEVPYEDWRKLKDSLTADIICQGSEKDGFPHGFPSGGGIKDYLLFPGIYDVLTLLAQNEKNRNPYFFPKEDAQTMTKEITAGLELRAREGRQWALDESKVGWRELLNRLAEAALKTYPKVYRSMGNKSAEKTLYDPATKEEIRTAEEKLGELLTDFKEMIRIANGSGYVAICVGKVEKALELGEKEEISDDGMEDSASEATNDGVSDAE